MSYLPAHIQINMPPSSSGEDGRFSTCKREFDSRWGHYGAPFADTGPNESPLGGDIGANGPLDPETGWH